MTPPPDNDALLRDVWAETTSPDFHQALLESTLRQVRRRRRVRQVRRVGTLIGALVLVAIGAERWARKPVAVTNPAADAYVVVRTEPLSPTAVVRTVPLEPSQFVRTTSFPAIVRTDPSDRVPLIDDEELLALAGPGAAVLVRTGPHSKVLVPVDGAAPWLVR